MITPFNPCDDLVAKFVATVPGPTLVQDVVLQEGVERLHGGVVGC